MTLWMTMLSIDWATLHRLSAPRQIGEIELPPPDSEHRQEQAKTVGREMRRVLTSHRDIARVSLGAIPVGPNVLRVVEWMHALLRGAGLPDRVVAFVGDLFGLYGAYSFEESLGLASPTGEDLPPEQVVAMLREYWESLPPSLFPHTIALLDHLFEGGPDERFEFGLDVIVRGSRRYDPNPRPTAHNSLGGGDAERDAAARMSSS